MSIRCTFIATLAILLLLIVGCGTAVPTTTAVPTGAMATPSGTISPAPAHDTPILATSAPGPATDTPLPISTATLVPSAVVPSPEVSIDTTTSPLLSLSFLDSGQRLGDSRSWDVALGDLDGDGDLDAVAANDSRGGAGSAVWLNDGQAAFASGEQDLGPGTGVALGDVDGDGDLDAFVVDFWGGPRRLWLNRGGIQGGRPGTFADSGQMLGTERCFDVALGDLDKDGDLDAFIAQIEGNSVWENDGSGAFTDTGQRLGAAVTAKVVLADLDGDGDLDALAAGWDEPGAVWLNDGTGTLTDSGHPLTAASVHVHGLALGDVDRDGDQDAFFAVASNHRNQVWLNDGTGAFVDSGQELPGSLAHGVSLGDLDGDGDLDAITVHGDTRRGSGGRVWLNDGAGLFASSDTQLGDRYSLSVALGDLDGDGDLDALVAHGDTWRNSGGGQPNAVWLNETIAAISTRAPISALPGEPYDTQTRPTDGMPMVYVPGGTFLMGSSDAQIEIALELCDEYPDDYGKCTQARFEEESPQHAVTLDGFWLDRTEVTNAQYALCVADGACQESRLADDPTYNGDDHPVAGISWQSAGDYCAWAGGRLPTEAEWEYAARGTEGVVFPWGDEFECAGGNFWDEDTGCSDGYPEPAPVGSFPAGSSWAGALDMAGNAWEWVADAYGPYSAETQMNPTGPASGRERILRGGSWGYPPAFVRAAYRYPVPPSADYLAVGFRCVGSAAPTAVTGGPPIPRPSASSLDQRGSRMRLSDEMVMVYAPGGTFLMGSTDAEVDQALARCRESYIYCNRWFYITEFPQHQVTVDGFWIDQTEVTNAQFRRCVQAGVCQAPATCDGGEPAYGDLSKAEHPVVCVDWHDAQTYCEWAGVRLPTEAEWEYAARGQDGNVYPWGSEPGAAPQNYCDANCTESWADVAVDDGYAQTSPVGIYPEGASWCGALDMAGNVYEWVGDWLGEYTTETQTNPTGPATGQDRVARGSSWKSFQDRARTAARNSGEPSKRLSHMGFRCASSMAVP